MKKTARHFLGLEQFNFLLQAFHAQSQIRPCPAISTVGVAVAILIAAIPALAFYLTPADRGVDMSTILVGTAACLAMVYRTRNNIPFFSVSTWSKSLRLTHIGFALGCIPALAVLAFYPEAFHRLSLPQEAQSTASAMGPPSLVKMLTFIFGVATWAALTEEFLYRGLVISVIRRWSAINSQTTRDVVAISVAALLFGLAHLGTWGPLLSFAVTGLGIGFGVAYIATGELILPLVVYHLVFDALSISFAIYFQH